MPYYWDSDLTAAGNTTAGANLGNTVPPFTWDTSLLNWWDGVSADAAWVNGSDTAIFTGTAGTVTLGAPVTAGGLVFNVGGYAIAGGGNALTLGGTLPTVTVTNAATAATIQADVVLAASAVISGAGNLAINTGVISGAFGFSKLGSGTLSLGGANTFSGPVYLYSGVTSISAANNLGDGSATNTLTLAGGTLSATGTFSLMTNRGPVIGYGGGVIDVTGANDLTVDGALSVAAGLTGRVVLTKTGSGTLILTGANNTSVNATTVTAGTLSIGSNTNLGTGRVTLDGATLRFTGSSATMTNGVAMGASGGTVEVTTAGQTLTVGTLAIIGPGSLTKTGPGTLQLGVASTFSGSTTISDGTLNGGIAAFLPSGTQLSIAAAGTLNMNAFATTVASLSGAGIVTNTGAAAALTIGNLRGAQNTTFSGSFNATTPANLTLTKTGGGTLTITSGTPGTATGAWTLNAGTVNVDYTLNGSATGNILTSRAITLTGGSLQITGRSGATVSQGLGNITVGARGGQILMTPSGGAGTTLALGTLAHVATAGASLLINAPATTSVSTTSTALTNGIFGGRYIFTDGTSYDWATNDGTASNAIKGLGTYVAQYTALDTTAGTDTNNSTLTGSATMGGSRTTNTLKLLTSASGQSLDLAGSSLVLTAGGLLFAGAQDYTITGGTLASNTASPSDLVIHQYGTGSLTVNSSIIDGAGASTLTKAGAGALVLGSANTFTGGIFINGGTLSVSNVNQLGSTATSAITINDGATFKTTADLNTGTHTFSVTGGVAKIDIAPATTLTVGGVISGAGGLSLTNTGILQINAAATLTGPVTVGAGATLKGGVNTFINAAAGGGLNVASGGLVDMNDFTLTVGSIEGAGNIVNSSATARALSVGGNNISTTYSGVLQATGTAANMTLTKTGTGILTLASSSLFTGTVTLSNGTIKFGVNNALAAGAITIGNAAGPVTALLDLDGKNYTTGGTLTIYGTTSTATSQAGVNIGAGGVLTLGGAVTVTVSGTASNGFLPSFITGGTLELGTANRTITVADSINAAVDLTITSAITSAGGAFGITKAGAGTLLLTGANTYTGTTTVNGAAGVLMLGGNGTLGSGTNALTMTTGVLDLNGTNQAVGTFSGAAVGTVRNSAVGTLSTFTVGNGSLITSSGSYAGNITNGGGAVALTKVGQGIVTLSGTDDYTGGTLVNDGILAYGTTAAKPATGTTTVAATAALGLGVGGAGFFSSADVDALYVNALAGVSLASTSGVGIDTTAGDFDYTTSLASGPRGIVKLGTNVLTLSGTNLHTGGTLIAAGTLAVASDDKLGAVSGALGIVNGGILRVTGTSFTSWNASRTLSLAGASGLDIADPANNFSIGINLTPAGAITKLGSGILSLAGTVTSASALNVNAGVLVISGTTTTGAGNTAVGNTAATQGLLRVPAGGSFTTTNLNVGNNATGVGAVVVSGGTATSTGTGTGNGLVFGNGGYGGVFVSSGTLNTGRIETSTSTAATAFGVWQQTGGTVNNSEWLLLRNNRFDAVITGGTYDRTGASQNLAIAYQGAATSFGAFTVAGGTVINTGRNVSFGQVNTGSGLGTGLLNLNAGTLRTNLIQAYNGAATATNGIVNFNGGTLQAAVATTDFIGFNGTGGATTLTLRSNGAFGSYAGGAVIDTNGFAVTLAQPIQAPTGSGVTGISLTGSGSGYIGAPYVDISGGGGSGATAYATVDLDPASGTYGQVTGITVTNPGVGYTSAPTVTLSGGGGTGAAVGTVTTAANVSGGLTKVGSGTLTLTAVNTYTGATTVNGGSLSITPAAIQNTSSVQVGATGNGTLDLYADGVGAAWNVPAGIGITLGSATTSGSLGFQLGTASDSIVLSGGSVLTVNAGGGKINAQAITGFGAGTYTLLTGPNNIVGISNVSLGLLPGGFAYTLDTSIPTQLSLTVAAGGAGDLYWTGNGTPSWSDYNGGNTSWATDAAGTIEAGYTPASGDTVIFSATNAGAGAINTTLDFAISIKGLKVINSGTGAVSVAPGAGGTLTIGTDGIDVQAGAPALTQISAPVALGSAQAWNVTDAAGTLRVSGALSGDFNLTKNGAGTVVLAANAARSAAAGTSTLAAGTLRLEALQALSTGAGIAMNLNGGTLSLAAPAAGTFNGANITMGGSAKIEVDRSTVGAGFVSTIGTVSIGALTLTVEPGSNVTSGTAGLTTGAVTLTGSPTFTVNNSGSALAAATLGAIGESGGPQGFAKNGTGTLILGSASTFTGVVTLDAGTLRNIYGGTTGLGTGAATLVLNGGRLELANSTARNSARNTTIAGNVTISTERLTAGAGVAHTLGTLAMGGQTLSVVSSVADSGTQSLVFGATTLGGDPTFDVTNGATTTQLTIGALNDGGIARTVAKSGNGNLAFGTAAVSLVNGTAVNIGGGRLNSTNATALGNQANVTVVSGATFGAGATQTIGALNGAGSVDITAALTLTVGSTNNLSSAFSGGTTATTGGLAKAGTGTLTLTGQNLHTGATTVNAGTLVLDFDASALSSNIISSSSPLVLAGGTLSVLGDTVDATAQTFASTALSANSFSQVTASAGAPGLTVNLATLTRGNASGLNVSLLSSAVVQATGSTVTNGVVTDSRGIAFVTLNSVDWANLPGSSIVPATYVADDFSSSANNVDVTASGNWTGSTVNTLRFNTGAPTLTLTGTDMIGAGGILITGGAGAVTLSGSGKIAGSPVTGTVAAPLSGELNVFHNGASTLTIGSAVVNNPGSLSHVAATVSGTALNKFGTGTLVLSAAGNAYSGGTNVVAGTLRLGAANLIPDGAALPGAVTVSAGATFNLNGFNETINGLAGAGLVDNASASAVTLVEGNTNATSTFSGIISNSGGGALSLTKVGTGTLTLTGANTYTGVTTVSAGGVTLNFTAAGAPLGNIISSSSALNIGSALLTLTGSTAANTQAFNNTTVIGGARITIGGTTPALALSLGAITRNAGTALNVTLSTGATTTTNTNDATGILGSWAVVNSADFATVNGSSQIVAYTGYTAVSGATGAGSSTQNALFQAGNSVDTATVDYNTVKLAAAPSFAAGTNILRLGATGAILMPTGLAATAIGSAAGNGVLTAGGAANTAGELNLINWSANALTINSAINNNGTGVVTLVKSGSGGVTLATANGYSGGTIINQGTLTASAANQLGTGGITLNGGQLTFSADAGLALALNLGAGGGTLNVSGTFGVDRTFGTAADLGTSGTGARILTLTGGTAVRRAILATRLVDGSGGPTSLVLSFGGDDRLLRLATTNTFTGTTTITRGVLDFSAATAIPGGLTSAATTGNLIFAATGTQRALLQNSIATPVNLTRTLGYGAGQIHWEGNGGFSNNSANTTWNVNLGGAGATLTWGRGGFVPDGSLLQFGVANVTNSVTNLGAVNFQNGIDLGSVMRTIEVFSANDKHGNTPYDAILSGNLTSTAGGGFTKTGSGVLVLTGTNSALPTTVTVTAGTLIFGSASSIPGSGANVTLPTVAGGNSAVGVAGDTNPIATLGSRIANPSIATSAVTLGASSSANLDFTSFPNMRLAAYAFGLPAKAITYSGTITPAGGSYLFGGTPYASDAVNTLATTLVLNQVNQLTGARVLDMTFGNLTITAPNDFTGGMNFSGNGIGNSNLAVGSNAALGTGTITMTGASTRTFGAVNGEHYLSNNIAWGGSATSLVLAGDAGNDGVSNTTNGGGITFLGAITISNTAAAPTVVSRTGHQALLLGDVNNGALTSGLTYSASTSGIISSLTTAANGGVPKTYNGTSIINSTATLIIDSDASFGSSGNLSMGGGGAAGNTATLRLQPGTGAVTLAAARTMSFTGDRNFEFRVGTGGTLTLAGVLNAQGTNTAARNLIKTDAGTLMVTNRNNFTGTATFTPGLAIRGGALKLDSSSGALTAAADRFFPDAIPLPVAFSAASGTFAGGGTLEIIQDAANAFALTQGFGNLTFNTGGSTIRLTNNSTTQALTLNLGSTFTRTALLGGTVNFATTTAGGANAIGSTVANANGIVSGYATFNGADWVTQSGGALVAFSGYNTSFPGSGSTNTDNYSLTGSQSVLLSQTINSMKFAPASGTQTIEVSAGAVQTVSSGGLLFDNTSGSGTIFGGGQWGATGAEVIVHTHGSGDPTVNKLTLDGVIKGAATAISKSGSGTLVLSGANTHTGALIINAGTVEYANGSAAGQNLGSPTAGAGNIILNGGTLRQTATNNLIYGMTVNGYAKLDVPGGVTMTQTAQGITGVAGVTGILQKTGGGTLAFSGSNDNPSLSLEVVGGVVNLGKNSSGTVHSVGVAAGSAAASVFGTALIVNSGATANITGTGGDQIHDQSSVLVRGGGVLNLGGGTAASESFDSLAGGGQVTNSGLAGTFTLTLGAGNNVNVSAYSVAAADAGVNATGLNNFSGVIADGGAGNVVALTKTGGGTQILSGNSTYSGATSINAGTLQLGIADALPSGAGKGNVTIVGDGFGAATINGGTSIGSANLIGAPGTLDMGGFDQSINGLNSTTGGYVVNNPTLAWNGSAWVAANAANTLTVGNGDANGSFSGILMNGYTVAPGATATAYTGTLFLTKTGSGTQTMGGANTYTGATTVNGGVLAVTGSLSGTNAVTVNSSATLLLDSSANADNIVNTAATYSGGGGTLKVGDTQTGRTNTLASLALSANSAVDFGAGTTNTLLFGVLDSTTAAALIAGTTTLTISGWTGSLFNPGDLADTRGDATQDRLLFSTDPGFAPGVPIAGINFDGFGPGMAVQFGAGQFEIVPVPEPASAALIGTVALCALLGHRSRRRTAGRACR